MEENLQSYDGKLALSKDDEPLLLNRFIVKLPDDFPIKSYHVEKVKKPAFNDSDLTVLGISKRLKFTFRNLGIPDIKVVKYWRLFNYSKYPYIVIEDLSPDLKPVSREYYTRPVVVQVLFDECDYSLDSVRKYTLIMAFEEVLDEEGYQKLTKK